MSPNHENPVLEVQGVAVARSGDVVIENANFTINHGDYVGIVGPNGGGKTTLLLAILKFIPHSQGVIRLFGQDIDKLSTWEKIAYIPQHATNFDPMFPLTVRELVSLGRIQKGKIGRRFSHEDWDAVAESIKFMGLQKLENRRIGELSGGEKQRVFVAKALTRNPEIIFLDEPVVSVDAATQEKFYKRLSDLNAEQNTTILIVTHDLTSVFCRMSKVLCVNKYVETARISNDLDLTSLLQRAYGEHFHFVFHEHDCTGTFPDEHQQHS
jgi:zinc transport system ATP-binding protein